MARPAKQPLGKSTNRVTLPEKMPPTKIPLSERKLKHFLAAPAIIFLHTPRWLAVASLTPPALLTRLPTGEILLQLARSHTRTARRHRWLVGKKERTMMIPPIYRSDLSSWRPIARQSLQKEARKRRQGENVRFFLLGNAKCAEFKLSLELPFINRHALNAPPDDFSPARRGKGGGGGGGGEAEGAQTNGAREKIEGEMTAGAKIISRGRGKLRWRR